MPKTRATASDRPLRYTLTPGLHSLVRIETMAGAACTLKPRENCEFQRSIKAYADPNGIARFYMRPSWACEEIAKLVIETVKDGKVTNSCVILSSSRNALSISSERTTNLFPSPRCASTIQSVRPSESTAETHPKLQPALLRLSAISSQSRFTAAFPRRVFGRRDRCAKGPRSDRA
jgi:hypothetical protein